MTEPHNLTALEPLTIGGVLARARVAAGLTHSQLGALLGRSRSWVSKCEHDHVPPTCVGVVAWAYATSQPRIFQEIHALTLKQQQREAEGQPLL